MATLTLYPATGRAVLSGVVHVGQRLTLAVVIDSADPATFADGHAYRLTIKRRGALDGAAYVQESLTVTAARTATVALDLRLAAMYTDIGSRDSWATQWSVDDTLEGVLGWTASSAAIQIANTAARDGDVADPPAGVGITADDLAAALASLEGLTLSDADPQPLADAPDPGAATAAARGDHKHARDETRYRQQTPATATEKGGAAVAPDFASSLTLPWTLTSNLTSFAAATNLADGESGMLLITIGEYSLPADPPAGSYKGAWTVTGPLVRVVIERIGSVYLWSADSLEVVS